MRAGGPERTAGLRLRWLRSEPRHNAHERLAAQAPVRYRVPLRPWQLGDQLRCGLFQLRTGEARMRGGTQMAAGLTRESLALDKDGGYQLLPRLSAASSSHGDDASAHGGGGEGPPSAAAAAAATPERDQEDPEEAEDDKVRPPPPGPPPAGRTSNSATGRHSPGAVLPVTPLPTQMRREPAHSLHALSGTAKQADLNAASNSGTAASGRAGHRGNV